MKLKIEEKLTDVPESNSAKFKDEEINITSFVRIIRS